MDKKPEPLPEGLNVIMHYIQNNNEDNKNVVEVNDECQNTEDS
jgi:hypothetical protein